MRWEYRSVSMDFNDSVFVVGHIDIDVLGRELNHHGREGWELVNIFDTHAGHGGTRFVVAVFKRQLL